MSAALAPLTPAPLPHLINEPQVMADGHGLIRQADHQSTSRSRAIRRIQRRRGFAIAGFAIAPWLLTAAGIFEIFHHW